MDFDVQIQIWVGQQREYTIIQYIWETFFSNDGFENSHNEFKKAKCPFSLYHFDILLKCNCIYI